MFIQQGCPDGDGDGYPSLYDQFPFDGTQHKDADSDGFGDNETEPTEMIAQPNLGGQFSEGVWMLGWR